MQYLIAVISSSLLDNSTVSILGQDKGYTVKYTPLPDGVPEGGAQGNSISVKKKNVIQYRQLSGHSRQGGFGVCQGISIGSETQITPKGFN